MPDIAAARPVAGQPIETAWGQQVHDAIEGEPLIQYGTVNITVDGSTPPQGSYSVIFPIVFGATPKVVMTWAQGSSTGTSQMAWSSTAADASSFLATAVRVQGAGNITVPFDWIAIGIR